jgi:hypothetical protein
MLQPGRGLQLVEQVITADEHIPGGVQLPRSALPSLGEGALFIEQCLQ